MAMTKKERAAMDEAINQARLLAALRWTEEVEPDIARPIGGDGQTTSGWDFNAYSKVVEEAWSTSYSHGNGKKRSSYGGSQGSIALYSTKLLALKAMRHKVECQAANDLLLIDKQIRAAQEGHG